MKEKTTLNACIYRSAILRRAVSATAGERQPRQTVKRGVFIHLLGTVLRSPVTHGEAAAAALHALEALEEAAVSVLVVLVIGGRREGLSH